MTRAEGVLNLYFNVRSTGTLLLGIDAAAVRSHVEISSQKCSQ